MAQSGYTPILIYASGTTGNAPSAGNLTSSASGAELALNYFDGKLFYKDASGNVQVLATKGTGSIGGSNTQVQYNNNGALAGSSNLTFNGTSLTLGGNPTLSAGTANGVAYLNGSKVLTTGSGLQFDGSNFGVGSSSNAWGSLLRAIQMYDNTGGAVAASAYAGYFVANTYNNGTNWLRVGASYAPSYYTQFDGGHLFGYASAGSAGSTISSWVTALQMDKSGGIYTPGYMGINATPAASYNLRIGGTNAQLRLEQSTAIRYRADFSMKSTGLEMNAFDDTGVVYLPILLSGSQITFTYGNGATAGASLNSVGTFATTQDAYFNSVKVGKGNSALSANTAVGINTLTAVTSGNYNTAIGNYAGATITTSPYNVAVGNNALGGASGAVTAANGATAVGVNALFNMTSGNLNTSLGRDAGYTNQTGGGNLYVGAEAGFSHTTGNGVFVGYQAGRTETTGQNCTYIGSKAGYNSAGSNYNTFIGDEAGFGHTTGANNTFVGVGAGYGANTMTDTLIIGQYNSSAGKGPGEALTSNVSCTLVGGYTGNQNGMDLRGTSNKVVISNGNGWAAFHSDVPTQATAGSPGNVDITENSASSANQNVIAIANGNSTSVIATGNLSGMVLINDINQSGDACLFMTGGGTVTKVASVGGGGGVTFQFTSTPASNQIGIYLSGSTLYAKNNLSGTVYLRVITFKTRVSQ